MRLKGSRWAALIACAVLTVAFGSRASAATGQSRAQPGAPATVHADALPPEGFRAVAADGGVFDFGTERFLGSRWSLGIAVLAAPIVGMAPTPNGGGYWLVGADGGVFSFGNATFYGSLPGLGVTPAQPVVGIASAFTGAGSSHAPAGYWLVARDGGVFAFGAPFDGSLPGLGVEATTVVGLTPTVDNGGYWVATAGGNVYALGDAPFLGDFQTQEPAGTSLVGPWVGMSTVAPASPAPPPPPAAPAITLSFASGTGASQQAGTTAGFDVAVSIAGRPDPQAAVTVTIAGANPGTLHATTGVAGIATVQYVGAAAGTDTVTASTPGPSATVTSNSLTVRWTEPLAAAATGEVGGNFFSEPAGTTTFVAKPGDVPEFAESFPDIAFNPPQGLLPIPPGAPDPTTVPFTDVLTDAGGAYAGTLPAEGSGYTAGAATKAGDLTTFDAVFRGTLVVAKPGYLTLGVISADGFLFGVGDGASAFSGVMQGAPASGATPFAAYPLMAASNACVPATVNGAQPQPGDFPVTIDLPAAGSYPYEVDYFSCDTTSGALPLRSMVLRAESFSDTAPTAPTVYVGYADVLRLPNNEFHYFPYPWTGAPGVEVLSPSASCGTGCGWDGGAVRIDNTTAKPLTITGLTYDVPPASPIASPYSSFTVPAGVSAIVAENFDTSDEDGVGNCHPDGYIPSITMGVDGTSETYKDTSQVLNTKGFDIGQSCEPANKSNESSPWTRIGGPGTGADVPLPPAASLTLAPIAALGGGALSDAVGTRQDLTVSAIGDDGNPIAGLGVGLKVVGANPQQLQATTDAAGVATFSYGGLSAGDDILAAFANYQGLELASGQTTVGWQIPVPGGASSGGSAAQAPPTIATASPPDGSSINGPTPVTAAITPPAGGTITSWSVQLTPASSGQGTTPLSLASGTGSPPPPPAALATLDPTQLPDGTYDLSVSATASGGGSLTTTTEIVVAGAYKPGRYQAVYQDLSFPAPGFSVGVQRAYDSIDKAVGDFGVGWRLQLPSWSVGESGPLGAGGWTASATGCSLFGCQYNFVSSKPHTVTVVDPSGKQEVFDFTPSGGGGPLYFLAGNPGSFSPEAGTPTTGSLSVFDDPGLYYGFDGNLYNAALSGQGIYDPTELVYTEPTGAELLLSTTAGLLDEWLPSGNCLDFGASGIRSFTGVTAANISGCAAGSQGPSMTIARDGQGRVTTITPPDGQPYSYTYDPAGDLVTVTPPAPTAPDTYTYDADHDLQSQTGPGTPLTTLSYDSSGRLVKVTDAAGRATTITNDVGGHQQVVADPNGELVTTYTYDPNGDLVREDRSAGGQTLTDTWTYDTLGDPTSHTGAGGSTTTATYDGSGNLASFTDADANTSRFAYNPLGEVTAETSPTGSVVYSATYSPTGEILTSNDSNGTTTYTYTPAGQVAAVTDADTNTTTYAYDGSGNLASATRGSATTKMAYDAMGDLTSMTDPTGHTTTYTFDSDGRLLTVTDGNGHIVTSDSYNPDGELSAQTAANGGVTSYTYTATGEPNEVTRADGSVATYSYNADGQLTHVALPDGSGPTYGYDAFGRLVTADDASAGTTFTYLPGGQTASQVVTFNGTGQAPANLSYAYDAAGNRTSVAGPAGTTGYTYNALNELTTVKD
ncbi:MAG: hypothetical protein ACRDWW_08415, partial [Acidimicrobiales bacterium]